MESMRVLKYGLRSINVLNLLLVAVIATLTVYLFPSFTVKATYRSPAAQGTPELHEEKVETGQNPPPSGYIVIAEQNLFHPERKIPPETKDEKEQPKPEIVLYGTLVADDMRLAYLEDCKAPQTTPGRGRRQTVVRQGDVVSGYLLNSIEDDRIVLTRGQEQIIALVNDPQKRREGMAIGIPAGTPPAAGRTAGATSTATYPTVTSTPQQSLPPSTGRRPVPQRSVPVPD